MVMLMYAIALLLILGAAVFALQAVQMHVRKEEEAKLYWFASAGCLAIPVIGFLIIRFF